MKKIKKNTKSTDAIMTRSVVVDLTDDNITVEEAIANCERARQQLLPWYKKLTLRIKTLFKRAA